MRYREPLTVPIRLDRDSAAGPRRSLHEQIASQVGAAVDQGRLAGGARLPSTRTLAAVLGVSRGVTSAAYAQLLACGYLEARHGSGTYVAGACGAGTCGAGTCGSDVQVPAPAAAPAGRGHAGGQVPTEQPLIDLTPGRPSGELFPREAWRGAWRRAAAAGPAGTVPPLGLPELRGAVARHLVRATGMSLTGHTVVVTCGTVHGLRLVLEALELTAADVALEDPAPPALRGAVRGYGNPAALPVDGEGACLDGVPAGCRALVLAPDGQVPLTRVMSPRRRRVAAAWARRSSGQLIEVVSAGVASPGAAPLPGLLTVAAADHTTLVGGLCEQLAPALQLGYALVPEALAGRVARLLRERGEQPSYVAQLAIARLLVDGTLRRLARRLEHLYAHKRQFLAATLAPLLGAVRLDGPATTGTAVLHLPDRLDAGEVAAALCARGMRTPILAAYHWSGRPTPPALVIGYGHLPGPVLRRAFTTLTDVLTPVLSSS